MNAPYDNESRRGGDAAGDGTRPPDDAYTRDTWRYQDGSLDDPYAGVDDLLPRPDQQYGQPGGPDPYGRPAPAPYDPRSGGYSTAQFAAGQFADPHAPYDPQQYPAAPYDPPPPQGPNAPYGAAPGPAAPGYGPQGGQGPMTGQEYPGDGRYAPGGAWPPNDPQAPYGPPQAPAGQPSRHPGRFPDGAGPGAPAAAPYQGPPPGPQPPGFPQAPQQPGQYPQQQPGGLPDDRYPEGRPYPQEQFPEEPEYQEPPSPFPPPVAGGPAAPAAAPQAGPAPAAQQPEEPAKPSGKAGGLMKSSALMAAGTMVSRVLGFVKSLVIAAAIGINVLGDSYASANTLPTLLYILIGGGAVNAVFVPQLVRSMKEDADGGEGYANRLLTLVMTLMAACTVIFVIAAPVLVRIIANDKAHDPDTYATTIAFTRYCIPTIFFMGIHVVLGQVLNARNRFGAMMWTPVLNNIVVITTFGLFIWVYGPFRTTGMDPSTVPAAGVRLLGLGTLLGLVVQALAMLPYVRDSGFRFRLRFDWRGHGLGKAARLARWTFLFVLANQAGLIVTTQLSNAAGATAAHHGHGGAGWAAYQNALQIWQLPQAAITVSLMTAVLPRISRAAVDGDHGAVRDDLSYGLRTSAVAIVPCAFIFLALGPQIGATLFGGGVGGESARSLGYILMAFSLGLIPYSAQYVMLRGFYAYEDTKTPFFNTVWIAVATAALSALAYLALPAQWAVAGMAAGYGIAYLVGVVVASRRLRERLGDLDGRRVMRTYLRLCLACVPAAIAAYLLGVVLGHLLGTTLLSAVASLVVGGVAFGALFVVAGRMLRIEEMTALVGAIRSKLGR